ncbi:hypothetical protein FBU30_000307 [Linnemannia zychae]|nr:hypothetical protein FBU30_000307 [Linnemannia zychae]
MLVSDHYHTDSGSLVAWYLSTESEGVEPVPDNGLINGRNPFDCSMAPKALFAKDSRSTGKGRGRKCHSNEPHAIFEVVQGLRYRIRIINTGSFADFKVSVDEHELTVIEADGVDMMPVTVQRVPIHVAQRYSVLLTANRYNNNPGSDTNNNFWIRAEMNTNCFNVENPALNPSIKAILRYKTPPMSHGTNHTNNHMKNQLVPDSSDWKASAWSPYCDDLKADMLKPVISKNAPPADIQVVLEMSFQTITQDRVNLGYVNRTSWKPQLNSPTLFQANDNRDSPLTTLFGTSQMVVTLEEMQSVELVVNNLDEGAHPFHLHGYVFYVVGSGDGSYIPGRSILNLENPLRRDTVTVPPYGYVVLRFVSDNPGIWAFHCHIEWHMAAGLMMQFLTMPNQVKAFDIPADVRELCTSK